MIGKMGFKGQYYCSGPIFEIETVSFFCIVTQNIIYTHARIELYCALKRKLILALLCCVKRLIVIQNTFASL